MSGRSRARGAGRGASSGTWSSSGATSAVTLAAVFELGLVLDRLLAGRRVGRVRDGGRRRLDGRLDHGLLAALGRDALVVGARLLHLLVRLLLLLLLLLLPRARAGAAG